MNYELTNHVRARSRQRGFRERDIVLVVTFGTPGCGGRYLLRARDIDAATPDLDKRERASLLRLQGAVAVVVDGCVVTVYWSETPRARRALGHRRPRRRRRG